MSHVYIVGFQKCGTTTLHSFLGMHPRINASFDKEPLFFESQYHIGYEGYLEKNFKHKPGAYMYLDSNHANAIIPYCCQRIADTTPRAKFIFLVRNPVERMYSAWSHWATMRPGREPLSFMDAIDANYEQYKKVLQRSKIEGGELFSNEAEWVLNLDPKGGQYMRLYIENSLYYKHIKRYIEKFGRSSVLIVDLADMITKPREMQRIIFDHLNVPNMYELDLGSVHMNKGRATISKANKAGIDSRVMSLLRMDTIRLSDLIGVNFFERWFPGEIL